MKVGVVVRAIAFQGSDAWLYKAGARYGSLSRAAAAFLRAFSALAALAALGVGLIFFCSLGWGTLSAYTVSAE
jgi:hypothetical protein